MLAWRVKEARGITGAGRNPSVGSLFAEVDADVRAYGLSGHRHVLRPPPHRVGRGGRSVQDRGPHATTSDVDPREAEDQRGSHKAKKPREH